MFGLTAIGLQSCNKEEPIPAYLYIPAIELEVPGDRSRGSNAHDILNAWVYVNGEFIGAFELPAEIPILHQGMQNLLILAGVKKNGQTNGRVIYPFYESYSIVHEFVPTQVDTIIPLVTYRNAAEFRWIEDFEDETISLIKTGVQSTVDSIFIQSDSERVYSWNGTDERFSAGTIIDTGYQIFEFSSSQFYALPRNQEIYLELNFRSEAQLIVGIYPITGSVVTGVPIVHLFPTDGKWKKVYISLTEDVNDVDFIGAEFRVFFAIQKNNDQTPEIFLDNIKLIHFE